MGENQVNTNESWVLERWLYIGKYWIDRTKEGDQFRVIDDETGNYTDVVKQFDKLKQNFTIGSVYEIEVLRAEDGAVSARMAKAKRLDVYHDSEYVTELQARHKIFKEQRREKQLNKKYNNGFEMPDDFAEIQKIYNKLNYSERLVFERLVIAKMRMQREVQKK
jgi:hypothetical protein